MALADYLRAFDTVSIESRIIKMRKLNFSRTSRVGTIYLIVNSSFKSIKWL